MARGVRLLESYLAELSRGLGNLPEAEIREITSELREHVLESTAAGEDPDVGAVAAVQERLGPAPELASQFETESLLVRAEHTRSPLVLVRGLVRIATVSAAGFLALLGLALGYGVAGSFLLAAVRKRWRPTAWGCGESGRTHGRSASASGARRRAKRSSAGRSCRSGSWWARAESGSRRGLGAGACAVCGGLRSARAHEEAREAWP
jgi:hypothetical protein